MTIYKKDLQSLQLETKALERKMEKLIKKFDTGKKARVTKKASAKATKKVPTKKAPTKKRAAKLTATDKVLRIIKGSKKGVDVATLMKKTGFNEKKVWNILHRVYKKGRVKRAGRGIYIGA